MTASKASFSKVERLRHASEFRSILRVGRSICESGLVLYFSESNPPNGNRLGIVVSRRVFKLATKRNRVKRVIREFFRLKKANFPARFDLVVRVADSSKLLNNNSLRETLARLFERAGLIPAAS